MIYVKKASPLTCNLEAACLGIAILVVLTGCASALNTAGKGDYACPGMPSGVLCKTPAAVYKSTHLDPVETEFDKPIGSAAVAASEEARKPNAATHSKIANAAARNSTTNGANGPRPVREPATVVRIWIAPWVDKQDNLHLAQTQYTEVKPRTWTVGKPESTANSGYVIPHRAYESIASGDAPKNERNEKRPSDVNQSVKSQASREANALAEPLN